MEEYRNIIIKRFDSYAKASMRNCLYQIRLKRKRIVENETITDIEELRVIAFDNYDFIENRVRVLGFDMIIKNDLLYEVLKSFEQKYRDVLYLSACESLSDRIIGERLNISRPAVQRIKSKAMKELRRRLIGEFDERKG